MVPTLLLAGAVLGRWWTVPIVAVAWAGTVVVAGDADFSIESVALAFLIGALNTAAGVLIGLLLRAAYRMALTRR